MKKTVVLGLIALMVPVAISAAAAETNELKRVIAWDLPALFTAPKIHETELCATQGVRSFFFEGAGYKGKPTWVYTYYAAPEGKPPEDGWPAVVCSHGGGGTAFPDWVKAWNKHGYAAISFDQEGHLPDGKSHENAGPSRIDWFGDRDLPDNEKWFYHAVADIIRAHSLLRSFPEINTNKIGLTGISWGATLSSAVAGIDSRFAFVVPVYGCGYIHESDNDGLACWFPPKHMTAEQFLDYRTKFDPSIHLPHARMPIFWMTGFDDPVFQIDIVDKSARAAGKMSTRCYRGHMVHGHGFGWQKPELFAFADSVVKGGPPMPVIGRPEMDPATRIVRTPLSGDEKLGASVHYTGNDGKWKGRWWDDIPCAITNGMAISVRPLPKGAGVFNVNARGARNILISSELVFPEEQKK